MTNYIPSGTTPELVIHSLNDYLGQELALPGTWSPTIFYTDVRNFPVRSKRELAELVQKANANSMSYLDFFEKSREAPRPIKNEFEQRVWDAFGKGSVMLYFEQLFLRMLEISEPNQLDDILIRYIEALSSQNITQWNKTLEGIGACCFQFFAKDPYSYAQLIYRADVKACTNLTDKELLDLLSASLSPTRYRGKISIEDSRAELIRMCSEMKE